jgi:antitoxin FitA
MRTTVASKLVDLFASPGGFVPAVALVARELMEAGTRGGSAPSWLPPTAMRALDQGAVDEAVTSQREAPASVTTAASGRSAMQPYSGPAGESGESGSIDSETAASTHARQLDQHSQREERVLVRLGPDRERQSGSRLPWRRRCGSVRPAPRTGARHPGCYPGLPMKTIQIRNVPDTVHATLRVRAAGAGVSLSDYALAELRRVAERPPVSDVLQRASTRAGGAQTAEIVAAVRAGRDRD